MATQVTTEGVDFLQGVQNILEKMELDKVIPEISNIKTLITEVQHKQTKLEQSLIFTQSDHEKTKQDVNKLHDENLRLKSKLDFMESKVMEIEKQQLKLTEQSIDSQYRSMQNNLVFQGLPEHKSENTTNILVDFIVSYLRIDRNTIEKNIWISKCHRFGQPGYNGSPRPIVATILQGKELILQNAKHLAKTQYYISHQLPPVLAENKRKVQSVYKNAKAQGKNPKFVGKGDTVLVDKVRYRAPQIPNCTLPISSITEKIPSMKIVSSHPINDQGNKFMSHAATVSSIPEISMALAAVKHSSPHRLCTATHNMFAARIIKDGHIQEFCDDDGEYGGSKNILEEMQISNVTNRVIVVSRWFSGIQLGRKRFNIIKQCTKAAILNSHPPHSPPQEQTANNSQLQIVSTAGNITNIDTSASSSGYRVQNPPPKSLDLQRIQTPVFTQNTAVTQTNCILRPPIFNMNSQLSNQQNGTNYQLPHGKV